MFAGRFVWLLLLCLVLGHCAGGPSQTAGGNRRGPKKLSDQEHNADDESAHNVKFDNEAFLGKEQAERFGELTPEESRRRLIVIIGRIDSNKDESISEEELIEWIRNVSRRYAFDDRDRHWDFHVPDDSKYLSWEDYIKKSFGMIENLDQIHDKNRNLTYSDVIARYERRFQLADKDGNKLLDREEFADFLHPHDVPHMKEIVVDEMFMDMDQNRDGEITLTEYLYDLQFSYPEDDQTWRERETKHFSEQRDKDGNGLLSREEISVWIFPPNSDPCVNEARHLIYHADDNKDKMLSLAEILEHQTLFVGSQATEHGKIFARHDEF